MKISILGATGYAGEELVRIFYRHPEAEIVYLTSESYAGKKFSEVYPHFRGICDMVLMPMQNMEEILRVSDFIFVALPHGHAMKVGKQLESYQGRMIDLGADYRFSDTAVYEEWYHLQHIHRNAKRVYGLSEWNRDLIRGAKIIGNAGCYTTASILALAPLVKCGLIDLRSIVIDAKSGVSGAGRSANTANHFPEGYDNFRAYGALTHRHTPEIEQALAELSGENVVLQFTPHLVPMSRGILSSCYASLKNHVTAELIEEAFRQSYQEEYFIRLLGEGAYPSTKNVRGSNYCDIGWHTDVRTGRVIIFSAIDNLVKGAAGQAVQNFNIACGFEESLGIDFVPIYP